MNVWRNSARAHAERRDHDALLAAISEWFGLDRRAASLLAELYVADGEVVPYDQLMGAVGVGLSRLRAAAFELHQVMEAGAIEAVTREGYRLTEIGRRECEDALTEMRAAA